MADNERELKRKRRKARAALVLLRRKITTVCGQATRAADFYDKVAAYTAPVMSEFGDVLPSDARGHMDRLMELLTERRDEAEVACNLCKGEVQAAIKGVTAQLGIQGAILNALRPIENVAPSWLVDGPLAEVAVAVSVILVGGGVAAGFAVLASGGGTEEYASTASLASSTPIIFEAETGPQITPQGSDEESQLSVASACSVLSQEDAQAILGGPAEVTSSEDRFEASHCQYRGGECEELQINLWGPQVQVSLEPWSDYTLEAPDVGDESLWMTPVSLAVRKGDTWADFSLVCSLDLEDPFYASALTTAAEIAVAHEWTAGIRAGS